MICPNCKKSSPDDSVFCQFCGIDLRTQDAGKDTALPTNNYDKEMKEPPFPQGHAPMASFSGDDPSPANNYASASEEMPVQPAPPVQAKRNHMPLRFLAFASACAMLLLLVICIFQGRRIASLQQDIKDQSISYAEQIDNLESKIKVLNKTIEDSQNMRTKYNTIVNFLQRRTFYPDFYCNKYLLYRPKDEPVRVTIDYPQACTLYFETDGGARARWGDWVDDTTCMLYVTAAASGINYVTITNSMDNASVRILVISD